LMVKEDFSPIRVGSINQTKILPFKPIKEKI